MVLSRIRALGPLSTGLVSVLLILLVAGGLTLAFQFHHSPSVFAASLEPAAGTTCAQAPSMDHCNSQDPERQGCTTDAEDIAVASINIDGETLGMVERRFSQKCQSWWGRIQDWRHNCASLDATIFTSLNIQIDENDLASPPTFVNDQYCSIYSPMIFDGMPIQSRYIPQIIGVIEIHGVDDGLSATVSQISNPTNYPIS